MTADASHAMKHEGDPVTGLARLGAESGSISEALARALDEKASIILMHVDLDEFGSINENMGDEVADETLLEIANRCVQYIGDRGKVWRIGSDEFIVALQFRSELQDAFTLVDELRQEIELPIHIMPYTVQVTATIGYSMYPEDAHSAATLLQQAEVALDHGRRMGSNRVERYSYKPRPQRPRGGFARNISQALNGAEFAVHYQPVVHTAEGRVVGVETLLRWNSREYGFIGPGQFLPVAEELGLMASIGEWMFEKVIEQAARWRAMGLDDLRIGVNVSTAQLMHADFIDRVESMISSADIPFSQFDIELSESTLARNVSRVRQRLKTLRDQGMSLTLDDFGVGGAGLAQLPRYPINKIKIDRGFVADVISDSSQAAIVRAIIAMGHQMNMQVVAEGVENDAQVSFLRRNHCDFLQGYLFGQPCSAEAIEPLLKRRYVTQKMFVEKPTEQTLLLVDDEENVLRALHRTFRREGYRILTASRIKEAFELLATNNVQVILSDQRMSDMTGTDFLERVKELYPDTVRLILSGYSDIATVTAAINRGAIYKYLSKPWEDDDLRGHIREAFKQQVASSLS